MFRRSFARSTSGMSTAGRADRRQFVKLCDVADFDDQALADRIEELVPGANWIHRKHWELALASLFLEEIGAVREGAVILDVGAGKDPLLYWLANRVRRVVAVDLYGEGDFAGREASFDMLSRPETFAPFAYRHEHLETRHMDARQLDFEDASFDAVFSLSSIEHFGIPDGVRRAAAEIGRVLRPGGHAFIVTECFVSRHPWQSPLLQRAVRTVTVGRRAPSATLRRRREDVFTWREIGSLIVAPSGLRLMQPLDRDLSPVTFENVIRLLRDGRVQSKTGRDSPHVLVRGRGAPFTSVAIALEKSQTFA
jgi:SAM-dependent methyltransferase